MLGGLLIASAVWNDQQPLPTEPRRAEIVVPIVLGAVALAVLIAEGAQRDSSPLALTLSGLAVATLLARMALSLNLNYRLLLRSREEALTDPVTGLGNNRRLVADLERLAGARSTLVLLDLNGFKAYNDRFGHPEGDVLLRRVGLGVTAAAGPDARTYRMGGDEFCVLLPAESPIDAPTVAAGAACAGEGFEVTAAFGAVALPDEAASALAALRLADERMYAHKRERAALLGER
jgi:diguanylate cyclase (GGDEF)-like protein